MYLPSMINHGGLLVLILVSIVRDAEHAGVSSSYFAIYSFIILIVFVPSLIAFMTHMCINIGAFDEA